MMRRNEHVPLRFFVVTFLWSWVIWSPLALAGLGVLHLDEGFRSIISMPAVYLGAFGPAVGACYSVWTLKGRQALMGFLKSFMSLRFGWKVWAFMFAVLGAVSMVAWYAPELFGHDRLSMLLPSAYVFPLWWLLMVLVGGGQEEIGWRGYIMEPLEAKFGIWAGNIVLGLVWAVWHIPIFFVPGSSQIFMPFAAFTIGLIGESFFFSWVIKASGGRPLSAVIAHGTVNAFVPLFPTIVMEPDVLQIRWWIHQTLVLAVGVLFMLHFVRSSRARGESRESKPAAPEPPSSHRN
jgi:membrane protease YdiL (CAAX protease family)